MPRPASPTAALLVAALCLAASGLAGCSDGEPRPPNVLWIVWDTVRADRLGLYGHHRQTTPFLSEWAAGARVFEDCLSSAPYTLASHASMFTGLAPSEHCTHNDHPRLADRFETLAELLRGAGYQTFLYSANPYVSELGNLAQGFERAEHPWSPGYGDRAAELVAGKLDQDRSSELPGQLRRARKRQKEPGRWNVVASGALAREAALGWLRQIDRERPFFLFLNYMEAHRPYVPARVYRQRFLSPEEVAASYTVDRSWRAIWEYTFGLREYDNEEIRLTRATYDAAVLELDALFRDLLAALEAEHHLDDTVIVLTSDHGEHLGEQHMLDHQYSVYQPLLRVPLIVHYPPRFAAGRDPRPVMSFDLFPTLLELTGVAPPAGVETRAVSLLRPLPARIRFAEDPASSSLGIDIVRRHHPQWDPSPWQRRLWAAVDEGDESTYKYIWGSDGRGELFDLGSDPLETRDLLADRQAAAARLLAAFDGYYETLDPCHAESEPAAPLPEDQLRLLRALGYAE